MAEGTIGSVGVEVTPDATGFWRRFEAATRGQAAAAGARAGRDYSTAFRRGAGDIDVRVRADTTRARAELAAFNAQADQGFRNSAKSSHILLDAITLLGTAAVPIGAVLTGGLAGAIPVLATAALGIKGIAAEQKSGALATTKYAADITALKGELQTLEAVAASGLLSGIDRAVATSAPLFKVLNSDIAVMSGQLGDVVAGAGPAFLSLFTQLNPLFVTFGNLVVRGASEFETWATSTGSISKFVGYVQAELPSVMQLIGNVAVLFGHIAEAAAPMGGVVLGEVGLLVRALDSLPIGVLQTLIPLIVATRAGLLAWRGTTAVINAVTAATSKMNAPFAARGAQAAAAAAATANAAAQEAAAVTAAALAEARAAEESAAAQVAALNTAGAARRSSIAAARAEAVAVQQAAAAQVAATEEAAAAAVANAERTAAAQTETAAAATASRLSWTAAIGPVGALAVGVGLLATTFLGSSHSTTVATQANQAYAESVKQSTSALSDANIQATAKQLSDSGAIGQLQQLTAANRTLGISYGDLETAVNGPAEASRNLGLKLAALAQANQNYSEVTDSTTGVTHRQAVGYNATGQAAIKLSQTLGTLRKSLSGNIAAQKAVNEVLKQASDQYKSGGPAAKRMASALGLTGSAYLAARAAAQKSTEQTKAQTAEFQLENDAASLLGQALDKLAGKTLGAAQAHTTLLQANKTLGQSFKDNGAAIQGSSDKALANQQAIQQQASSAEAYASALAKQTGRGQDAIRSLREARQAALDDAKAHNALTPAVRKYVDGLYSLKSVSDYLSKHPTRADLDKKAADAKIAALKASIKSIHQGSVPGLTANNKPGKAVAAELQREIDAIRQHGAASVTVNTAQAIANVRALSAELRNALSYNGDNITVGAHVRANAKGSAAVYGRGDGTIPPNTRFTVGEAGWEGGATDARGRARIFSHQQSMAMGFRAPVGYASGSGNLAQIIKFFTGKGLSGAQASGIAGNFKVESGFNPKAYNAGEGAIGLAQWENGRRSALESFARKLGTSSTNLMTQLQFAWKELTGSFSGVLAQVRHMSSPARIAALVDAHYEISSGSARTARENAATAIYRQIGSGSLHTSTGSSAHSAAPAKKASPNAVQVTGLSAQIQAQLGNELIKSVKISTSGLKVTMSSAATAMKAELSKATSTVAANIASSLKVNNTPSGYASILAGQQSAAIGKQQHASIAQANVATLTAKSTSLTQQAAALKLVATREHQAATAAAERASRMPTHTAAERRAKNAAEDHALALKHAATASSNAARGASALASAASKAAGQAKTAYSTLASAAKDAATAAADTAKELQSSLQDMADALSSSVSDFSSSIAQGIIGDDSLSTLWGNIGSAASTAADNLTAAQQAVADATPDTSALAAAQQSQASATANLAAAQAALQAAQSSGDTRGLLRAQQQQSDAVTALAAANANLVSEQQSLAQQAGPTAEQINALTAAQTAYNAATAANSVQGLQDNLNTILTQTQTFATDLQALAKNGADQDLISQIAGMGAGAGDQLAKQLLAGGKATITQLQNTLTQISNVAGAESTALAKGFYGAGVQSLQQLEAGFAKQFPGLKAALAPLAAQLAAMFTFTPTVNLPASKNVTLAAATTVGALAAKYGISVATLDALNASLAKATAVTKLGKGASITVPAFASGVKNFSGGLALAGERGPELVNLPRGSSVIPSRMTLPALDNSRVVKQLESLNTRVESLAGAIGIEVSSASAAVSVSTARAQAQFGRRYARKRLV